MSLGFGMVKLAAALLIGACAGYALSQSSNGNAHPKQSEKDLLQKRSTTDGVLFTSLKDQQDSFENADVYPVYMTIAWVKSKVKSLFDDYTIKKVALITAEELLDACPEIMNCSNYHEGYFTDAIVTVDYQNHIKFIQLIKNVGTTDPEVSKLYGLSGMVVINR